MLPLSWPQLLSALLRGQELSRDETAWAMNEIMSGAATPAQIAGFAAAPWRRWWWPAPAFR
jgi:anthranilate phosphoribosyltransferase